jgi:hypothetical protein
MNRRFIAPFLAVDVSGSLAGRSYSGGSPTLSSDANGDVAVGPATDPPIGCGAIASPESANPGCPPNRSAQRLS